MDIQSDGFAQESITNAKNLKNVKNVVVNIPEESFDTDYHSPTVNDNGVNRCKPIRGNFSTQENNQFERTKGELIASYHKNVGCEQSESQCKIKLNDHTESNIQENIEQIKIKEAQKKLALHNEFDNFEYVTITVVGTVNNALEVECDICFDTIQSNEVIGCSTCKTNFCENCLQSHIKTKLLNGAINVRCPGDLCNSRYFSEQLIGAFANDMLSLFLKNQVEVSNDPTKKTCPNCHKIEVNESTKFPLKKKILCENCRLEWCFPCHAPWHDKMTCKKYKQYSEKDNSKLETWAEKSKTSGKTAMKCPECKCYIEKISGCDNMICTRCKKCFCYKCGNPKISGRCKCIENNREPPTRTTNIAENTRRILAQRLCSFCVSNVTCLVFCFVVLPSIFVSFLIGYFTYLILDKVA